MVIFCWCRLIHSGEEEGGRGTDNLWKSSGETRVKKRQRAVDGYLETQKRAERQRVVLAVNLGDLRHTPGEAIVPGERKTAAQAQHPIKWADHNQGRETIKHFSLGKGRNGKVSDRVCGLEWQRGQTHTLLSAPITQTFLPESLAPGPPRSAKIAAIFGNTGTQEGKCQAIWANLHTRKTINCWDFLEKRKAGM